MTYFKQSVSAADLLRAHSDLKLIQSVETRWNSTYYMINRFVELADKIGSILLQCPNSPEMITAFELQTCKEFLNLLKPFEEATSIICGELYVTGSKVIPIIYTLRTKMHNSQPTTETGKYFKKQLVEQFNKRFENIEQMSTLAICTILDPRFKNANFVDRVACAHATNKISRALKLYANDELNVVVNSRVETPDTANDNFWSLHVELVNINESRQLNQHDENEMGEELRYYLHQRPIKMSEDPIIYWEKLFYSPLGQLAKKYQTIIATSVPSERLFSKAGNILNEARNRLSPKNLQYLLFLSSLTEEEWGF